MDKIQFPRRFRVYAALLVLATVITFLLPRTSKFAYDYKKGEPWAHETLVAKFDFPILKTELQLQKEKEKLASEIVPYFRHDASQEYRAHTLLGQTDLGRYEYVRPYLASVLSELYSRDILPDYYDQADSVLSSKYVYVQREGAATKVPVDEMYTLSSARDEFKKVLRTATHRNNIDSIYSAAKFDKLIHQDLIIDKKITDDMYKASIENLSPTIGVFKAHQTIVKYGDMVTAEVEQLLDSYKKEYDSSIGYNGREVFLWIGNAIIAIALVFVLFLAIYYCNDKVFTDTKKYLYLLLMFLMSFTAASLASKMNSDMFYIIPFNLLALYLLAFFKRRMVYVVYIISLIPLLLFAQDGIETFVIYMVSGAIGMLVFERFNKGWLQFVTAFIVFVTMVLIWVAFRLVEDPETLRSYAVIADMALSALLMVAAYPLIYLFEKIFRLVSTSKLVELSDTSNKLLRMLADKAPGTFQHSLQVMNLADAAARSIDANVPLVRAGALYHDIGKISNPQCFTENAAAGIDYHAGLSPKESAQEIIKHVADGVALAEKHHLPQVLIDFIRSHHGTTNTAYFYNKYLNDGGDPSQVSEFYYDGIRPTTKEQVILMLCDTIEAASRSLKDYSQENVSALVDRIIEGKVEECQLSCADISLRELNILKDVIKSYLMQMHHSRVAYPKRKGAK